MTIQHYLDDQYFSSKAEFAITFPPTYWQVIADALATPKHGGRPMTLRDCAEAEEPVARSESEPINQCDGCRRGLTLGSNGHHYEFEGSGAMPVMACTADRYTRSAGTRLYWLVESAAFTPRRYWTTNQHRANSWEIDPAKAIRYATQEEAMRVVMMLNEECEACEHMDCSGPEPELVLDKPAQIGSTRFGVGVKWSTVIDRAQREHEYQAGRTLQSARTTITHDNRDDVIEQCALLCESYQREGEPGTKAYEHETAAELAARIRATKNPTDRKAHP